MNRATKLVVILSNLTAVWLIATFVSRGGPPIFVPTVTAFALSCIAAALIGDVVVGVVLSLAYVVPAACFAWYGTFLYSYYAIWVAALCGSMLPRAAWSSWAFPGRFTLPLVMWALVVALSWPVIVFREVDFVPELLVRTQGSMLSHTPAMVAVWVASVTTISLTGLLLLDWLFLVYAGNQIRRFEARVIWPMFAGALCAACIAAYQATIDITFLNHTFFGAIARAVGTMRDANAFGSAMAFWVPVAVAMVFATVRGSYATALWFAIVAILAIAVWASGSRTALLATLISLFVVIRCAWGSLSRRQVVAGALALVALCAIVGVIVPSTTWMRAKAMVPSFSRSDVQETAYQLWSRDLYGTAALHMIAEHPLIGVGVGGFAYQLADVLYRMSGSTRPQDNAQNWYRQQLAELGLIGSVGWMLWMGMFLWLLAKGPHPEEGRMTAAATKGAVLGLAAACLLGIPTQDTAVSISFVVIVCWYMKLTGTTAASAAETPRRPSRLEWVAILSVVGCFLAGTVYAAATTLRPPVRATLVGDSYRYGFFTDRNDPATRWTARKAVEVFRADKVWMKLTIGDVAPDAASNPVRVEVWLNRDLILSVNRRSNFPITRWIRMPPSGTPMMMQINVDRTWRPRDVDGSADRQERGVAIREWSFVWDDPPKGSISFPPPAPIQPGLMYRYR